jgi:hypothetical protein
MKLLFLNPIYLLPFFLQNYEYQQETMNIIYSKLSHPGKTFQPLASTVNPTASLLAGLTAALSVRRVVVAERAHQMVLWNPPGSRGSQISISVCLSMELYSQIILCLALQKSSASRKGKEM